MVKISFVIAAVAAIGALASQPAFGEADDKLARSQLVATGRLRVAFVIPNSLVVRKDPVSGEFRGMSIELGREIARRLGVDFAPVGYPNVMELNRSTDAGSWDLVVRSYEGGRAAFLDFTIPFMEVENTFLVPPGSVLQHASEFDRPGIRLVMSQESAADLFFKSNPPKHATVQLTTGGPVPNIEMLKAAKADAWAHNKEVLIVAAQQFPGSRVLDGSYSTSSVALAVPKGRTAAVEYLNRAIEELKASGFIQAAMQRSGLRGTRVSAPK